RHQSPDKHEELIAEMVGLCWRWFVRLVQRGKDPTQFVSALASYAARAVHSGRRLCGQERSRDVLSPVAQRRHGFVVEELPAWTAAAQETLRGPVLGQRRQDAFEERLRDNPITPVPDQVQFRIDFPAWLQTLTGRERRIIRAMGRNERTGELSRRFEVSPARI